MVTVCSCIRQPAVALANVDEPRSVGAIQVEVRQERDLTQGVRGAQVEVVAASDQNWWNPLRRVVADTTGLAVVAGMPPARYAVRAWAAGHDTVTQRVSVSGGQVKLVRISLREDRCKVVVTQSGPVCM
jgi:hypothetical protein